MYQNNPNIRNQPFRPQMPQMARTMLGAPNPYGFGNERMAGRLAIQPNLPGSPTNALPRAPQAFDPVRAQRLRSLPFGY